jgi:hypothetical protein
MRHTAEEENSVTSMPIEGPRPPVSHGLPTPGVEGGSAPAFPRPPMDEEDRRRSADDDDLRHDRHDRHEWRRHHERDHRDGHHDGHHRHHDDGGFIGFILVVSITVLVTVAVIRRRRALNMLIARVDALEAALHARNVGAAQGVATHTYAAAPVVVGQPVNYAGGF